MSKKAKPQPQPNPAAEPEATQHVWYLPEYGVSVEAPTLEEAVEIAKSKKEEEGDVR
ncbi:hypothetical protein ACSCB1_35395 [Streptomyces europaeiscabiei]|uniref:hypothetical protein n=1 Tax=Streptomyces europaeiscabiei TaxID=146819 RepID=UPI000AD96122|nr:hypothetical protein [Streptomyces europaeiscabiei]